MTDPAEQHYTDVFGESVALAGEVKTVILEKHPEAADFVDSIGEVLSNPDEVRRSVRDERVVLYYQYREEVLNGKWVVVVVKRVDRNFISTIYATDQIKAGDVIWTK